MSAQDASQTGAAREAALEVHADVLAPKMLEVADKTRLKAEKTMARSRDAARAIAQYTEATLQYNAARERAIKTAAFLEEALIARNAAVEAQAQSYALGRWEDGYEYFEKAIDALERERDDKALSAAKNATQIFKLAELEAIQNRILAKARAEISAAEKSGAARYAPITFERARSIAQATETALSEDRYAFEHAENLARQAEETARHSVQVADIVRSRPNMEGLILRWEAYFSRAQAAAGLNPPVDQDPDAAADELEETVAGLLTSERQLQKDLANNESFAAALEDEIRDLDEQLSGASAERTELVLTLEEQAREQEQIKQTEDLFRPNQAQVFKQSNTIIVRLMGLRFTSGSAKFSEGNDTLLSKLRQAIQIWPESILVIEGHTDSRGSERLNQRLSQNRAETIMNYVISTMHVPANRISAVGYGENRPIASNENEAGRAKNRRIDLLITP
ncbi:MAG: OmpA family protein [Gammaproteobacteria bacterium]|nr:OmpA family protein [Gammaproteobacteria bacterium]